ncbi:hypothetical protein A6R68_13792, partial [Neotoma lepida]
LFFGCVFIDAECVLLAVMAFDRYKAISNPLMYAVDMSNAECVLLAVMAFDRYKAISNPLLYSIDMSSR